MEGPLGSAWAWHREHPWLIAKDRCPALKERAREAGIAEDTISETERESLIALILKTAAAAGDSASPPPPRAELEAIAKVSELKERAREAGIAEDTISEATRESLIALIMDTAAAAGEDSASAAALRAELEAIAKISWLTRASQTAHDALEHVVGQALVFVAIIAATVMVGVQTYDETALIWMDWLILVVFGVEVVLRWFSTGLLLYFGSAWNWLDVSIVAGSISERAGVFTNGGWLVALRVLRLARIFKVSGAPTRLSRASLHRPPAKRPASPTDSPTPRGRRGSHILMSS
jgi:hypothetical protein